MTVSFGIGVLNLGMSFYLYKKEQRNFNTKIAEEHKNLIEQLQSESEINDRNLAVQYITNKRIEWIQELRKTYSEFAAHCFTVFYDRKEDYLFEINRELAMLRLFLNAFDEKDKEIIRLCKQATDLLGAYLEDGKRGGEFERTMEELNMKVQIYLKVEWERVKWEIEGNKWTEAKKIETFDRLELK